MEQLNKKIETKVGIFILAGLTALLATILALGGDKSLFTRYVRIETGFSEVQGLFPGSVVSLSGVPVGNVEAIDFRPSDNQLRVTLRIARDFQPRLLEGTVAEIRTQGALGDKFVYLIPGPPSAPRLTDGAIISSIETDLMKMLTSREDGVARVIDLIKEIHVLVATLNQNGHTAQLMANMSDAAIRLKATLVQLDAILGEFRSEIPENKRVKQALTSLASILEKVDQGQGTLGQLINDPSLHQNLKSLLGGSARNRYMKDMLRQTLRESESGQ
jgi:phospholipid/cholesterol/gamma-HCH transport system substrate-binding protein